jgi:NTE family protein
MRATRVKDRLQAALCGLSAVLMAAPVAGQDAAAGGTEQGQRPRVGLVLAGGGAKGGAHVGVLKVLEEQRVKIDCIAGTSMGALVGAGYAAGMPAAELDKFLRGIDWESVVGGVGRRQLEPIEQKRLDIAASSELELGLTSDGIVTPAGLTNTSGIDDLLRSYVARARAVSDFDQLPIPYRAVATDMVSGTMVVLDHGDLATAMRASMAIPGAFAPVVWGDYILADGGQVRNIPVDVARQTCADVVIVVNLVEPPTPREKLMQAQQLIARSMEVMLEANENLSLASLGPRDIRIDVPMGDIGTADFTRVPETIPLGEAAARKVADRLAAYSVPDAEYVAWRNKVTTPQKIETRLAGVRFEGLKYVNPEFLATLTTIKTGDVVDIEGISADAMRMSALQNIDTVSYRLEGDPANPTLVWLPVEASVGPNVVRPALGLYGSHSSDFKFVLGAQFVRYWMNDRGAQWRNNVQLGYDSLLSTSWYQPFDVAQRFFVEPRLFGNRTIEDVYIDTERVAEYSFSDVGGNVDLGLNASDDAQLRVGYFNTRRRADVLTGIQNLPSVDQRIPDLDTRDAGLLVNALYDSRDTPTYALQGAAAQLQYFQSADSMGADRDWNRIEGGFRSAVPFSRSAMWISVAGGTSFGDDELPGDRAFALGGPRTLPAYQYDELRARSYWLADVSMLWRVVDIVEVKNQALYAGFGLQAAGLYDRVDMVPDGGVYSVSGYLGGPTPLGTVTLGGGYSPDSWGVWLSLGRPIGTGSILDDGLFR